MITVTDLFCGAGGSGLGATAVPGVQLVIAANHDIEHPTTRATLSLRTSHELVRTSTTIRTEVPWLSRR